MIWIALAILAAVLFTGAGLADMRLRARRRQQAGRVQPPLGDLVRHPALDDYLRWRDGLAVTEVIVAQPTLVIEGDPDPALGCRPCTYPYCVAGWETEAHPW